MGKKQRAVANATTTVAAPPAPPRHRKLGPYALAGLSPQEQSVGGPTYTIAKPMPNIVPSGARLMAQDDNFVAQYDYASQNSFSNMGGWLGYPTLAQLSQLPEYRKVSEIMAQELTRKWIKLHAVGNVDKSERITKLWDATKKFRLQELIHKVCLTDGLFGRAQVYIDTGVGQDEEELQTPLLVDKRKLPKGGLKNLSVIEPIWTYPGVYNSIDPLGKNFYEPTAWYVMGRTIHVSRLLTFVSRPVPDILKPAYSFGGISYTQLVRPYVENWLRTRQSVSDLIHMFSVCGIKTDMSSVLNGDEGGIEDLISRAEMFTRARDNRGLMLLSKGSGPNDAAEEFFNVSVPLSTLDALQAQSEEQIATMSNIPIVKYFGSTPAGLNASTDGEIRVFYDQIFAIQRYFLEPNLRIILDLIQQNEFGDIDPDIDFTWESLWTTNETELAAVRKTNADAAVVLIDAGVLSPEEERTRLAAEEAGLYNGLDPNDVPEPPIDNTTPGGKPSGGETTGGGAIDHSF